MHFGADCRHHTSKNVAFNVLMIACDPKRTVSLAFHTTKWYMVTLIMREHFLVYMLLKWSYMWFWRKHSIYLLHDAEYSPNIQLKIIHFNQSHAIQVILDDLPASLHHATKNYDWELVTSLNLNYVERDTETWRKNTRNLNQV